MPILKWIKDEVLLETVKELLAKAALAKSKASASFGKNVIDPFSAVFEMSGFNLTHDEWLKNEESRQAQKTLQNFIGDFHQTILGSCKGWKNMGKGNIIDLLNEEEGIIAEVKNKYNTISGGKQAELYASLDSAVMNKTSIYKNNTAYYVSIIPNKPERFNKPFTPSDKEKGQKCPTNELIRHIDGASFYHLVTGNENALEQLFESLPFVIKKITQKDFPDENKLKALFKQAYGQ